MTDTKAKTKVDSYLKNADKWKSEQTYLRKILLSVGLEEDFKWMHPCYSINGNNIVLIHAFKDYCALLVFKGALMKDPKKILIQQTKNVQERRQIRFTSLAEVKKLETTIKSYVKEAIKLEESGAKLEYKKTEDYEVPDELENAFDENPALREAFEELTPGRQRGYLLYFSSAKQSKTRVERIDKHTQNILEGIGYNEEYSRQMKDLKKK